MSRPSLEPGQDTIDSSTPVPMPGGGYQLQWRICLLDGRVEKRTTKCKNGTKGDVRRRAKAKAADLLTSNGTNNSWKSTSLMSDYVEQDAIPYVESNGNLRPRTKDSYIRALRLFAKGSKGYKIANAVRPRILEQILSDIASTNGTATAKQVQKVVSKQVMQRLVRDEVIASNPLRDFKPQLPEHVAKAKPAGGQAIPNEDRERLIEYLLDMNPEDVKPPARGKYTKEDLVNLRKLLIDVTLVQATMGMRIGEVRLLPKKNVDASAHPLIIEITPEISKTHKGRRIPLLDERVEERLRERLAAMDDDPDALVFPAPAAHGSEWDYANAQKALAKFYAELADALDIPLLKEVRTHVWRATLNTDWMQRGIPSIIRAAYFGHSEDVNEQYYTDLSDIAPLIEMLQAKSGR